MCGIVGVFSSYVTKREQDIFKFLLYIDTVRGEDSTGVISVKRNMGKEEYSVDYMKKLGLPTHIINTEEYKSKIIGTKHPQRITALIGHNRAATRGNVTARNAHPFRHNHITLVHNGTLNNSWDPTLSGKNKQFEVDSEALTWGIAKHGIEAVWEKLNGAATLVWWDSRDNEMNWITNGQRPFHWMMSSSGNDMVFASEEWMLQAVERKFNFRTCDKGIRTPAKHNIFHTSFDETNKNKIIQWGKELKNSPVVVRNNNYYGQYSGNYHSNYQHINRVTKKTAPGGSGGCETKVQKMVNLRGNGRVSNNKNLIQLCDYRDKDSKQTDVGLGTIPKYGLWNISACYPQEEFTNKFNHNCANCDADIDYHKDYLLDGEDHIGICHNCYSQIEKMEGVL